jgi:EAL domain-containing protein (putative c-di-GMP-specific phosphodiesterase class I)
VPAHPNKIQRRHLRGVPDHPNNAAQCPNKNYHRQCHGLKVVAQGVETGEELAWLRANGCDGVQGYLFARPAPFAEMLRALGRLPA